MKYIEARANIANLPYSRRKIKEEMLRDSFREVLKLEMAALVHQADLEEAVAKFIQERENRPDLFKASGFKEIVTSLG